MRNVKKVIAQKIVQGAHKQAHRYVGKSFPMGMYEVRVPRSLQIKDSK